LIQDDRASAAFSAWSAASALGIGLALIPGVFLSLRRILGWEDAPPRIYPASWFAIGLLLPLALGVGYLASRSGSLVVTLMLVPAVHLATSLIAAAAIVVLILRRGPEVSPSRASAAFTIGLTVIPFLAVLAEAAILIPAAMVGAAWLLNTPEGTELVRSLIALGSDPGAMDPRLLETWLQRPGVVASIFAFTAGVVPVVEELAKSSAVWPWLRRNLTPSHGFLIGALAGAAYGLFEALFLSQPGPEWAVTAVGRVGAALMHAATAGITGWGLTMGVKQARWGLAFASYGLSVAGHSVWNFAALAAGYEALAREAGTTALPTDGTVAIVSTLVLVALTLGAIVLLSWRKTAKPGPQPAP
jgi:hypothetical protein